MSLRSGRDERATVNKVEGDWEVVAADRWRTNFRTLPVSYPIKPDPTTKKWHRQRHCSFLFYNPHRKRALASARQAEEGGSQEEEDCKLNVDLPGVRAALDSVALYEDAVGFHFEPFPSLGLNLSNPIDLTVDVDENDLLVNKKRWDEMLEDLMNGPAFDSDDSLESSFVGSVTSSDLHRSTSEASSVDFTFSEGSIDSTGMPSTPRPKSSFNDVQIKETSPRSMDFRLQPLSPMRALNASASSFVPSSAILDEDSVQLPPLSTKAKRTPSSEFSFTSFTFPTLNSHTPAALRIKKDELEGNSNHPSEPAGDLLPPFFQDSPQRVRTRKSRTREIVDRLRSQTHPTDLPTTQSAPCPTPKSSEGSGESATSPKQANEEDDGWVEGSSSSHRISPSKTKRARELLLALARRRTDSLTSEGVREIMEAEAQSSPDSLVSREMSPSPSPSPPLATPKDDGWKESATATVPEAPKKTKSHTKDSSHGATHRKKISSNNSRGSASSSTHPHPHRTTQAHHQHQPMQQQQQHHHPGPQYSSPAPYPSHPSAAYPSHPMAPAPQPLPYYFPYPTVPMSVPYGTYLQPHYPMGVGVGVPMHAGPSPLLNPAAVLAPNGVPYSTMPPAQMVPVPMPGGGVGVPRLGAVPTKGVQAASPNMSVHSSSSGTASSYRQPLKHAAAAASPLW